jgi:hypothetical protein
MASLRVVHAGVVYQQRAAGKCALGGHQCECGQAETGKFVCVHIKLRGKKKGVKCDLLGRRGVLSEQLGNCAQQQLFGKWFGQKRTHASDLRNVAVTLCKA